MGQTLPEYLGLEEAAPVVNSTYLVKEIQGHAEQEGGKCGNAEKEGGTSGNAEQVSGKCGEEYELPHTNSSPDSEDFKQF